LLITKGNDERFAKRRKTKLSHQEKDMILSSLVASQIKRREQFLPLREISSKKKHLSFLQTKGKRRKIMILFGREGNQIRTDPCCNFFFVLNAL
jgi:hypothetical protein